MYAAVSGAVAAACILSLMALKVKTRPPHSRRRKPQGAVSHAPTAAVHPAAAPGGAPITQPSKSKHSKAGRGAHSPAAQPKSKQSEAVGGVPSPAAQPEQQQSRTPKDQHGPSCPAPAGPTPELLAEALSTQQSPELRARTAKEAAELATTAATAAASAAHRFKAVEIQAATSQLPPLAEPERRQLHEAARRKPKMAAAAVAEVLDATTVASSRSWYSLSSFAAPHDWGLPRIQQEHEKRLAAWQVQPPRLEQASAACGTAPSVSPPAAAASVPLAADGGQYGDPHSRADSLLPALVVKAHPARPPKTMMAQQSLRQRKPKGQQLTPPLSAPPPPRLNNDGLLPRRPREAPASAPPAAAGDSRARGNQEHSLLSWLGFQANVSWEASPGASPAAAAPSAEDQAPQQPATCGSPADSSSSHLSPSSGTAPPSRQAKFRNLSRSQSLARQSASSSPSRERQPGSSPHDERQRSRRASQPGSSPHDERQRSRRASQPGSSPHDERQRSRRASLPENPSGGGGSPGSWLPPPSLLPAPSRMSMMSPEADSAAGSWLPPPSALPAPSRMSMSGSAPESSLSDTRRARSRSRSLPRLRNEEQNVVQAV